VEEVEEEEEEEEEEEQNQLRSSGCSERPPCRVKIEHGVINLFALAEEADGAQRPHARRLVLLVPGA